MGDEQTWQFGMVLGEVGEGFGRVGDDAGSAQVKCGLDIAIAVGGAAAHGYEDGAGANAAGVVFDASDFGVGD